MSNIDWSQMITKEMKEANLLAEKLAEAQAQIRAYLQEASQIISVLQDAVDFGEATPEEEALLLKWKKFRIDVNRVPTQSGYPSVISWPVKP